MIANSSQLVSDLPASACTSLRPRSDKLVLVQLHICCCHPFSPSTMSCYHTPIFLSLPKPSCNKTKPNTYNHSHSHSHISALVLHRLPATAKVAPANAPQSNSIQSNNPSYPPFIDIVQDVNCSENSTCTTHKTWLPPVPARCMPPAISFLLTSRLLTAPSHRASPSSSGAHIR